MSFIIQVNYPLSKMDQRYSGFQLKILEICIDIKISLGSETQVEVFAYTV